MWLKQSASKKVPLLATALLAVGTGAGCKKTPVAQLNAPPERVYVSVTELERSHPLALTVRQLEQQAQTLQQEKTPASLVGSTPVLTSPLSSGVGTREADAKRNQAARREVLRSAIVTLERYDSAVQNTLTRIRAAERDELEGIARANSASEEAAKRTELEQNLRDTLTDEERIAKERDALIRRNAMRVNLRDGNVLTLARDPKTGLPDKQTLEAQIAQIQERQENPPGPSAPPLVVSDEARLTKTLRDQQALLNALRKESNDAYATYDRELAAAIARIYADDLKWVEEQLAKSTRGARTRAQIAALRQELTNLIANLNATASSSSVALNRAIPASPATLAPIVFARPVESDVLARLAKERRDLKATIHQDVTNAVRDAGLAHHVEPVFSPAYNLPNKTVDFRTWIFGNVPGNPLSKNTK